MVSFPYNSTHFLLSAHTIAQLPKDTGREIAFVGRSNSGKSTAINSITGVSKLAKTSKTPGKTQSINFFEVSPNKRFVDLPGYGYAKVSAELKHHWETLMEDYFHQRRSLCGIILLMDVRRPLTAFDWQMIEWTVENDLPTHILLTKEDKLKRGQAKSILLEIRKELSGYEDYITVQLFSGFKGTGLLEVHQVLKEWFENP